MKQKKMTMRAASFAISVAIVAAISGGCEDKTASQSSAGQAAAQRSAAAAPATPAPTQSQPAAAAAPVATAPTPTPAAAVAPKQKDGPALFRSCVACHGPKADKQGMNKGRPPSTMTKDEIVTALKSYKAGTNNAYGTGALMKGNMSPFSEQDIETVAAHIKTLK